MTPKPQWIADYEAAYFKANGSHCVISQESPGWFAILKPSNGSMSYRNFRKSEIVAMAARLEDRISGKAPQ